jgi:hypothetical protein
MRPLVWIFGIILAALAVFGIIETTGRPGAIPYSEFLDQLGAGNIASVTFQGTQIDGHFKHSIGQTLSNGTASQNIFRSRVPDFGDPTLIPELRKQHVAIDVTSSSSWTRLLANIPLPMWLFLAAIVIAGIVRLVRGGKTQSGTGIPMQGIFGFVLGLFAKKQTASPPARSGKAPPNT